MTDQQQEAMPELDWSKVLRDVRDVAMNNGHMSMLFSTPERRQLSFHDGTLAWATVRHSICWYCSGPIAAVIYDDPKFGVGGSIPMKKCPHGEGSNNYFRRTDLILSWNERLP